VVIVSDGDANIEVQQLIEGYIQQTEQLRSSIDDDFIGVAASWLD